MARWRFSATSVAYLAGGIVLVVIACSTWPTISFHVRWRYLTALSARGGEGLRGGRRTHGRLRRGRQVPSGTRDHRASPTERVDSGPMGWPAPLFQEWAAVERVRGDDANCSLMVKTPIPHRSPTVVTVQACCRSTKEIPKIRIADDGSGRAPALAVGGTMAVAAGALLVEQHWRAAKLARRDEASSAPGSGQSVETRAVLIAPSRIPGSWALPDAELVSLGVQHYGPARPVAFSLFDHRGTKTDKSFDLSLRLFGCEIDMHAALSRLGLRDLPEQDSSDASLIWCRQCSEVTTLSQRCVAGNF